jgi:hypothetical protein
MTHSEDARRVISEISGCDIDTWVRPSSFTQELEEVSPRLAVLQEIVNIDLDSP